MDIRQSTTPSADHRKQMLWQVWVPLGVSILIVLSLVVLTIVGAFRQSDQIERWGNLSAVWVIIPVLLVGFVFLAVVSLGVYGMSKLLNRMPGWMLKLQLGAVRVALIARRVADASTRPVMAVNGTQTRVKTLWQKIFGKK